MAIEREVRRGAHIECEDDDGHLYTVVEWQAFVRQNTITSEGEWNPGYKHFELLDGRPANPLDRNMTSFKIVENGKIINAKD